MSCIQGNNNNIVFIFPNRKVNIQTSDDTRLTKAVEQAKIYVTGNDNYIAMHFDSEASAEEFLTDDKFLLVVKGDGNWCDLGNILVRSSPILGMTGLKLIIGQLPGLGAGVSRTADHCKVIIGNHVVINGATIYLQENCSSVTIGNDSQISWGVDIWCTDAHTITDLNGAPTNHARSIDIGHHVWIGKDVKIGKNVRICDNSIVGWGSIVTKRFDEPNVIIAGIPAQIVKSGINWDRRNIDRYLQQQMK